MERAITRKTKHHIAVESVFAKQRRKTSAHSRVTTALKNVTKEIIPFLLTFKWKATKEKKKRETFRKSKEATKKK
ncbi:CLUMA_CG003057, isoform A [Clunio marinus]|uniref:CLUMA_CG003057, isoform A n=1 Tax=Clunio marinus TaxID=568069 RepID=A0A1J1HP38_9DIPT|nr:CLUMA_CG003057, isoform A [Clunio marinus]